MTGAYRRSSDDRSDLRDALASRPLTVVGLCAAWCDTCGEFFDAFDAVATERPDATFVWLDIEDDADLVGEIEVENFPTLAVFDGARPIHFGVSLPQAGLLRRLVRALDSGSPTAAVVDAVARLPRVVAEWLAARPQDR